MLRKKNQCRTCRNVMISPDSKLLGGRCYFCRNYTKIQRLRMVEHDVFMKKMEQMPVNSPFQKYEKRIVREELLFGRKNFIKYGRMDRPTKYKDQEKIDNWVIQVALKNPEFEKKIIWAKLNKGMLNR